MALPKGLILILHNGIIEIPEEDCIKALPTEWLNIPRETVRVRYSETFDLNKLYDLNYGQFALEHRRQFSSEILQLINQKPDFKIIYFGLAPIPLIIDFGQLFHNFRDIEIYQKHHVTKLWYHDLNTKNEIQNNVILNGVPDKNQKGISDALVRINISHEISQEDTSNILPNAAEVDISLETTSDDGVTSKIKMTEIGERVKLVLDTLSENKSGLTTIHLFAAIPCGVAFLIGTKISPNIHPFIQTYRYSKTKEPRYKKAILVKGTISPEPTISDEDKKTAKELRELANTELTGSIKEYLKSNESISTESKWYQGVVPVIAPETVNGKFWNDLPALYQTSLGGDQFDFDTKTINDGFYWRNGRWYVDDNFFIAINRRLGSDKDVFKKAVRLFLFHESLHYKKHKLTDQRAANIGSFPKVLEIADYQADVYGILNEYGYCTKVFGEVDEPKKFFMDAIQVATETMWSFDDNGINQEQVQIRRLNRYLIWYWQLARIEKEGNTINEIVEILEHKPIIELNGLKTKEENNRFYFNLMERQGQHLELAVFHNNEIIRDGSASNMPIENLVTGFIEMKGEPILNVMRSFVNC